MESGSVVFAGAKPAFLKKMDSVQRYFTYRAYKRLGKSREHFDARNEFFGLHTLSSRRFVADLVFVHKVHGGISHCSAIHPETGITSSHRPHRITYRPSARNMPFVDISARVGPTWNSLRSSMVDLKPAAFLENCQRQFLSFR